MSFKNNFKHLLNYISQCCLCFRDTFGYGPWCKACLELHINQLSTPTRGFKVHNNIYASFLWHWKPGDRPRLSDLIYGLKGGGYPWLYERVALRLYPYLIDDLRPQDCLVPVPGRRSQDHAWQFARALSNISGATLACGELVNSKWSPQKKLSKQERLSSAARFQFESINLNKFRKIFLVDDVVTTGSTANLCRQALGLGEEVELICLARRSALQESGVADT